MCDEGFAGVALTVVVGVEAGSGSIALSSVCVREMTEQTSSGVSLSR